MIYFFLADGFEEVEAFAPIDLLRRADLEVVTVGINKKRVVGAHSIAVESDIDAETFLKGSVKPEMIVFPGGMPGTKNLDESPISDFAISLAAKSDAFIAAICAAPMILGKRGLLCGRTATCYPGFEKHLEGAFLSDKHVVRDGKIITAAGMGVAVPFGLELVSALKGSVFADKLRKAIIFE
jgi:4-methyl-5(b-hydroxyethyl)-thiazole monophosphate biosynthesis